jgi:molybdate transport system substrate-binding protein
MVTPRPALTLFCAMALRGAINDSILPAFTRDTGILVDAHFAPTSTLIQEITADAHFDVIIGIDASLEGLDDGILDGGPLTPIAKAGIGVAVAPGAEIPEIATVESLTGALTGARSVAYPRNSPSGIYFAKLLQDLGIAERVNEHATVVDQGCAGAALLDGRADLAMQQMSELIFFPEARIAGPLPADVQHYTAFSAGVALQTKNSAGSGSLTMFLSTKLARDAYNRAGLEPS